MQYTQQALQSNFQAILKLEIQIGQLASVIGERENGKFPSQPIPNSKGQFEVGPSTTSNVHHGDVKSIITLESGKIVDNQVRMLEKRQQDNQSYDQSEPSKGIDCLPEKEPKESVTTDFFPKAPYP